MKILFFLFSIFLAISIVHAEDIAIDPLTISLKKKDIKKLELFKPDISRAEFDKSWGEFQIQILKQSFPMPVVNCKKILYLRMIAVMSMKPDGQEQLDYRWNLFQSIINVMQGKLDHIDLPIEFSMFSKINKKGEVNLEHCGAFISEKNKNHFNRH